MSSARIDKMIDNFDFNRVKAYKVFCGTHLRPAPTIEQMRKNCRELLEDLERDDGICYITHDGFVAVRCDDRGTLSLFYPLEIYEE